MKQWLKDQWDWVVLGLITVAYFIAALVQVTFIMMVGGCIFMAFYLAFKMLLELSFGIKI